MSASAELSSPTPRGFWSWAPWLIGVAGVLGSIAMGLEVQRSERTRVTERFELDASERVNVVRTQFAASIRELELVASLLQSDPRGVYWEDSLKRQLLEAGFWDSIAWARFVPAEERRAWERRMQRLGRNDQLTIRRWDGDQWIAARDDPQYVPVQFLYVKGRPAVATSPAAEQVVKADLGEPPEATRLELGWDLSTHPQWWELLLGAEEMRQPILLLDSRVGGGEDRSTFQILVPAGLQQSEASPDENLENSRGYLIATAHFDALFTAALGIADAKNATRSLLMQFVGADGQPFYTHPATFTPAASIKPQDDSLRVAGSSLRVRCLPTPYYVTQNRTWTPILWFVLGVLFTAILAGGSHTLIGRAARIERLVASRTSELQMANQQLQQAVRRTEKAKEALRESTAAYESLVESLPLNIFRKDREGRIISANRRFSETLGRPLEEILNKRDEELFPPELVRKYRQDDLQVMQTAEALEDVETHVRPDGERLHVRVMKAPARDANNRIVGVQGMFWDVTPRIRAERAQRLTDARLRRLVESDLIAVAFTDLEDRILHANDAYLQLAGYEREDLVSGDLTFRDVRPEGIPLSPERWSELRQRGACRPWEDVVRHRDGRSIAVLVGVAMVGERADSPDSESAAAAADPAEDAGEYVVFAIDISARKAMENELKQAKDQADAANRAKSQFLANMSHEMRTPLNAVLGMTELVLATPLNAKQTQYLTTVRQSGESLLKIIDEVLDLARVEAGKLELDAAPFRLTDVLGDAVKTLAVKAHEKGLELYWDVSDDAPEVLLGDSDRLRQVIVNLTANAIKFTERGEVSLNAAVETVEEGATVLRFHVRDTGPGIPSDKFEKVFAAFEQVDPSMTRKYGGAGLGLAIASSLVQLMGGRIWVESEIGQGSDFQFTARFGIHQEQPRRGPLREARVLLVDPHDRRRRILGRWLRRELTCVVESTFAEAGQRLSQAAAAGQPFQVVVVDSQAWPTNSAAVVQSWWKSSRVLLLTDTHDGTLSAGVGTTQLLKPPKPDELVAAIIACLKHDGSPQSADQPPPTPHSARALRILLAEDSLVNQAVIRGMLDGLKHSLVVAADGREAVEWMERESFDVVLMDVQMPVLDGLQATRLIRRREEPLGQHTPIIALTAHALESDRRLCLEAGMDEHLAKPVRRSRLLELIDAVTGEPLAPVDDDSDNAGPETTAPSMIDWDAAMDSVQGNRDLMRELVEIYLQESPKLLDELERALDQGDSPRVRIVSHTLKGSTRYFGELETARLAYKLEELGRSDDLKQAPEHLRALRVSMDALLAELRRFLRQANS